MPKDFKVPVECQMAQKNLRVPVNFQVAIQCQVPDEGQVVPVMCQSVSESEVSSIAGRFPSAILV